MPKSFELHTYYNIGIAQSIHSEQIAFFNASYTSGKIAYDTIRVHFFTPSRFHCIPFFGQRVLVLIPAKAIPHNTRNAINGRLLIGDALSSPMLFLGEYLLE